MKKRLMSLLLCLTMALAWLPAGSPASAAESSPFDGGSGTAEDPYLVSTAEQLAETSHYPNTYFLQINDIDLTGVSITLGMYLSSGAVYDGGGHAIEGLKKTLFSGNDGTIRNLTLVEPSVSQELLYKFKADMDIGILTNSNSGTIENCHVTGGTLQSRTFDSYNDLPARTLYLSVGILTGKNTGLISNCCVEGDGTGFIESRCDGNTWRDVTVDAQHGVGGIAGQNASGGRIENCHSDCTITARRNYDHITNLAGLLCGYNEGTITGSYFGDGEVTGGQEDFKATGGGDGSVEALQVTDSQEVATLLNEASGEPYWERGKSGSIQLTARTLGASASLPSGTYDMQLEQPELRMATKITVPGQEIFYTILGQPEGKQPYTDPIPLTQDTRLLVYGQLSDAVYQVSYYTYRDLRNPVRAAQEAGTYDKPIQVVLSTEAEGAVIYYTTDGTDPAASSTRYTYTGPIGILSTTTIRAVAAVDGVYGDVMTYDYVISPTITANPGEGDYTQPMEVTLAIMDGYELWYTTDGSNPTQGWGIKYEGPITICQTTELKVAAFRNGSWGEVKTFSYRYPQVTITAQPAGGEYEDALWVTLACSADYAQLSYRLSGKTEQTYEDGIGIYATTQLTAYARYGDQLMATETFTYTLPKAEIQASPVPGNYQTIQTIALSCNRADAELWYALDSWYPERDGTRYTGPFELDRTATVRVAAKLWGKTIAEASFSYNLTLPEVTASPASGDYKIPTSVTLSTDAGYEIWYTVDGSDPKTNGIKYEGPIQLDEPVSTVIRAVPKSKDFENVWGTTSEFSYNLTLPKVTASPASGDYKVPLSVNLYTDSGYEIWYTVDGSDPAVNGIKYEGAFRLEEPVSTVVRVALKAEDYEKVWSVDKEFRYTFNSYFFRVQDVGVEKRENYEITARLTNTLLEEKEVTLYAAAYRNGKQLNAAMKQVTIPANTSSQSVSFTYPSTQLLPEDAVLKVFCLDSVTRQPYCEAAEYPVSQIPVIYELDSLTARPTAIEGYEGDVISVELTAHYLNGKADQIITPYSYSSGNSYVARASSGYVTLVAEGSTTVTYTYAAGGVAKSVEIPVTVKAPTYHLGFLADPTADELPADAIPISSAQELAALSDSSDGAKTAGKTFYLTQDIQLTGEWSPVYGFQGTLDGRGHTVSGLYISSASKKRLAGLFASAYDATIKNLAVEIDARGVSAYHGSDVSYAGGLVGHSNNTNYINCYTTGGPVSASGMAPYAGGLVGYLMNQPENQVTNCFSNCEVSSKSTQATTSNTCMAGGLIGELESGDGYQATAISRCYATGNISLSYPGGSSGRAGTQAGGLLGGGIRLEVRDCFALGDVTARRTGISTGSSLFAGGLGGWLIQTELTRCYAAGDVSGGSKSYVGGLTAAAATINSCYRVGQSVTGTEYYNGGTLVTVPYAQSSYSGFDFTSTWQFTQGAFQGLPHLQYQD